MLQFGAHDLKAVEGGAVDQSQPLDHRAGGDELPEFLGQEGDALKLEAHEFREPLETRKGIEGAVVELQISQLLECEKMIGQLVRLAPGNMYS